MTRGPAKPNLGARFSDVEVAQHGKARRDTARGGVGEHTQVGNSSLVEEHQSRGDLGKLHQANRALLHTCAAGSRNDNQRNPVGQDRSIARVIFSPTTAPMLPPMNFSSRAQIWTRRPFRFPVAESSASGSLVAARISARRWE